MFRKLLALTVLILPGLAAAAPNEAEARKARSIAHLEQIGMPVLDTLPVIETVKTSTRRSAPEVADRLLALAIVAVKGETGDPALGDALTEQFKAKGLFSPREQAFMDDAAPDMHSRTQFAWRYEGVAVLLWALSIYDDLPPPTEICDVPRLAETLRALGPDGLRRKARLRSQAELLDAADLIYRTNWAVVQARLDGTAPPAGLDPGVVYERHYVLNWLIGYGGQAWDNISTDT